MHGTKSIGWSDGSSPITAQRRRYFGGSRTPLPREGTQESVHRQQGRSVVGMRSDVGAGHGRGAWAISEGRSSSRGVCRRPGVDLRVCQHVERFMKETGRSMAEGRHLAHLLQLEFRDVVRRGEEMEVETACLQRRIRQMEDCRREKDAIDRGSFAGMVSAHSDASAELKSRLEKADRKIQELEAEKQALLDKLNAKESSITDLERRLARLVTSARVKHETANRARTMWEQRISAKWEAYWSNRCRGSPTWAEDPSTAWKHRSETTSGATKGAAAAVGTPRAASPLESKGCIQATLRGGHVLGEAEGQRYHPQAAQEESLEEKAAVTARAAASAPCRRCRCRCCPCHRCCCCERVESKSSHARDSCGSATPSEASTTSPGASHRQAKHWSDLTALSSVRRTSRSARHGPAPLAASSDESGEEGKEEGQEECFSEPAPGVKFSSGGCDRPVEKQLDSATAKKWGGSSNWASAAATMRYETTTSKGQPDGSQVRTNHLKEGTRRMRTPPLPTSGISPLSMVPLLIPGDAWGGNTGVSGGGAHELPDCQANSEEGGREQAASTAVPLRRDRIGREEIVCDGACGTPQSQRCSRFRRWQCVDDSGAGSAIASDMQQQQLGWMSPALYQQQQQQQRGVGFQAWTGPVSSDALRLAERQGRPQGTGRRHNVDEQDTYHRASTGNKLRTPTTASVTAATNDTVRRQPRSPRAAFDRQQEQGQECAKRGTGGGCEGQRWKSTKELTTSLTTSAAGSDRRDLSRAGGEPAFGGSSTAPAGLGADEHRPGRPRQRQEYRQGREKAEFATAAEVAAAAAAAVAAFGANQREDATVVSSPVPHCSRRQEREEGQKQRQRQRQRQRQQDWLEDHHQHGFCRQQQLHHEREHEQLSSPLSSLSWAAPIEYSPQSGSRCAPSRRIDGFSVATETIDSAASKQVFCLHDTASPRSQSQHFDSSTSGSCSSSSSGPVEPRLVSRHRHRRRQQREHATGHGDSTAPPVYPCYFSASEPEGAPIGGTAGSAPMPGSGDDDSTDHCSRGSSESEFSGGLCAPSDRSDPTGAGGSSSSFARGRSPAAVATRAAAAACSLTTSLSSSRKSSQSSGGGSNSSHSRTGCASSAAGTTESWSSGTSAFVPGNRSGSRLASTSGWAPASSRSNFGRVSVGAGRGDDSADHADDDGGGGVHRNSLGDVTSRGGCHGYLDLPDQTPTGQAGRCPVKSNGTLFSAARGRAMIEAR